MGGKDAGGGSAVMDASPSRRDMVSVVQRRVCVQVIRLKQKDIKEYREYLLGLQQGTCPLCQSELLKEDACLDHDHVTGHVRFALHKSCNSAEGRIVSWAKRSRAKDPFFFLKNLYDLHRRDYSGMPIHPTFLTPQEKQIKKLRKRIKTLKTQRGKDNVMKKIREIQDG